MGLVILHSLRIIFEMYLPLSSPQTRTRERPGFRLFRVKNRKNLRTPPWAEGLVLDADGYETVFNNNTDALSHILAQYSTRDLLKFAREVEEDRHLKLTSDTHEGHRCSSLRTLNG